jgi:hypothetical protein
MSNTLLRAILVRMLASLSSATTWFTGIQLWTIGSAVGPIFSPAR